MMKEKGKKEKSSSSSRQNPNSSTTILPISNNNKHVEGKQDEDSKLCLQVKSSSTSVGPKEELVEEEGVDEIYIHIETLDELTISAKLRSFNANVKSGGKLTSPIAPAQPVNEFLYAFKVQHLPPIVLTCLLPKSYPSHQPPCFTIFVQWLNSERSSNLCHMLDSFWTDKPGQEVIYQWVDWLHSSSLSHLGFDKEIALGPYNMPDAGDRRAFSGSVSPEVDMPSMLKYNDDKCVEVFCENLHECCICFSEHAGTEFIRLPCKHFFCWKCMETYSRIHVKEGTVYKLVCPDAECDGMVPPGLLKRLLARDDFEHWESLLLQKTLDSMSDVVYCPRCETACLEDGDGHAQCLKCFFSFCILCSEQRHVGTTCMGPEKRLQTLMELKELRDLKEEQSYEIQELNNEILSLKIIFCDAKQCPSCNIAISRIEGCNRMQCRNCGQIQVDDNNHMVCLACQKHYCYLCRKSFEESSQHYTLKDCRQQHTAE
ncbi:hypothetical protein IFM89_011166 [Coptis chinensis]|uniref:RBR-type E3 ubiquitin transferase n=1 Tax=Coptis chinensis TaxID=261450 RepID=A0A835LVK5_9MAGN|nr:hypothetical protein IFM89_011166 [Coptis chinensis]